MLTIKLHRLDQVWEIQELVKLIAWGAIQFPPMKRFRRWLFYGVATLSLFSLLMALGIWVHGAFFWFMVFMICLYFPWQQRRERAAIRRAFDRKERGLCVECGYDLRGKPDRCPECGTVAPKEEIIRN